MCKVGNPIVLIADTAYAEKNPEITAKFLSIYLRAVNMLQKEPLESLVPEYQRFFLEWAGKNYSPELSLTDLKTHPVYNLEEQLALFDTSKGMSTAQKWQSDIAKFFASVGAQQGRTQEGRKRRLRYRQVPEARQDPHPKLQVS